MANGQKTVAKANFVLEITERAGLPGRNLNPTEASPAQCVGRKDNCRSRCHACEFLSCLAGGWLGSGVDCRLRVGRASRIRSDQATLGCSSQHRGFGRRDNDASRGLSAHPIAAGRRRRLIPEPTNGFPLFRRCKIGLLSRPGRAFVATVSSCLDRRTNATRRTKHLARQPQPYQHVLQTYCRTDDAGNPQIRRLPELDAIKWGKIKWGKDREAVSVGSLFQFLKRTN